MFSKNFMLAIRYSSAGYLAAAVSVAALRSGIHRLAGIHYSGIVQNPYTAKERYRIRCRDGMMDDMECGNAGWQKGLWDVARALFLCLEHIGSSAGFPWGRAPTKSYWFRPLCWPQASTIANHHIIKHVKHQTQHQISIAD